MVVFSGKGNELGARDSCLSSYKPVSCLPLLLIVILQKGA